MANIKFIRTLSYKYYLEWFYFWGDEIMGLWTWEKLGWFDWLFGYLVI